MKYLYIILLFASCQKIQTVEVVTMPDLLQYDMNTNAARMYDEPGIASDTLLYFQNHIYTIVEKPNSTGGINRYFVCSGPYSVNVTALTIDWTQGPLKGKKEVLQPVESKEGFTKMKSQYRDFWLKH